MQKMNKTRKHYKEIVTALRAKTIQNGATAAEAQAAIIKANEIEKKYLFIDPEDPKHTQKTYATEDTLDFHDIITSSGFRLKTMRGIHYEYESIEPLPEYHVVNWFIDHGFRHEPRMFGDICEHRFIKQGRSFRVRGYYGHWNLDFADYYSHYHDDDALKYDITKINTGEMTVGSCRVSSY